MQRALQLEATSAFLADGPAALGLPARVHVFDAKLGATQQGLVLGEAALQQALTDVLAMCAFIDTRLRSKGKSVGAARGGMAAAARLPAGEGVPGFSAPAPPSEKERRPRGHRGERGRHSLDEDCNHAARVLGSDIDPSFAPLAVLEWLPSWEALCLMVAADDELRRDVHQLVVDVAQGVPGLLPSFSAHPLTRIDAPVPGEGLPPLPFLSPAAAAASDPASLSLHMPTYLTGDAAPLLSRLKRALVARDRRAALKLQRSSEVVAAAAAAELPLALCAELDSERCSNVAAGRVSCSATDVPAAELAAADAPRFKALRNAVQLLYSSSVPSGREGGQEPVHTPGPTLLHTADAYVLTAYPVSKEALAGVALAPASVPSEAVTSTRRGGGAGGVAAPQLPRSTAAVPAPASRGGVMIDTAVAITLTQGHLYVTTPGARGPLDVSQAVGGVPGSCGGAAGVDDPPPPGLTLVDGLQPGLAGGLVAPAAPPPLAAAPPRAAPSASSASPAPAASSSEGAAASGSSASSSSGDAADGDVAMTSSTTSAAVEAPALPAEGVVPVDAPTPSSSSSGEAAAAAPVPPTPAPAALSPDAGDALLQQLYARLASPAALGGRVGGLRVTSLSAGSPAAAAGVLRVHDVVLGVVAGAGANREGVLAGAAGSVSWGTGAGAVAAGATLPPASACSSWDTAALQAAAAATTPAWLLVARPRLAVSLEATVRGLSPQDCLQTPWPVPAGAAATPVGGETSGAGAPAPEPLPEALPGVTAGLPGGEALDGFGGEAASLDETSSGLYEPGTGRYLGYHVTGRQGLDTAVVNCRRRPPPPPPGSAAALALAASGAALQQRSATEGGAAAGSGTSTAAESAAASGGADGAAAPGSSGAAPVKLAGKKRPSHSKSGSKTPKTPKAAPAATAASTGEGEAAAGASAATGEGAEAAPAVPPPAKRRKTEAGVAAAPVAPAAPVPDAEAAPAGAAEAVTAAPDTAPAETPRSPAGLPKGPTAIAASAAKTGPVFVNLGDATARLASVDPVVRFSETFTGVAVAAPPAPAAAVTDAAEGGAAPAAVAAAVEGDTTPAVPAVEAGSGVSSSEAAPAPAPVPAPAPAAAAEVPDEPMTGPVATDTTDVAPTPSGPNLCPPSLEGRISDAWKGLPDEALLEAAKAMLRRGGINRRDVLIAAIRAEWWLSRLVAPQSAHGTFVPAESWAVDASAPLPCRSVLRLVLRHTTAPVLRRLVAFAKLPTTGDKQVLLNRIFSYLVSGTEAPLAEDAPLLLAEELGPETAQLLSSSSGSGGAAPHEDGDVEMGGPTSAPAADTAAQLRALHLEMSSEAPAFPTPWTHAFPPVPAATCPWVTSIPRSGLIFLPPYEPAAEAVLLRWFYPSLELLRALPEAYGLPSGPRDAAQLAAESSGAAEGGEAAASPPAASNESEAPAAATATPGAASLLAAGGASLATLLDSSLPVSVVSGTSRSGRARKPSSRVIDAVNDTIAAANMKAASGSSSGGGGSSAVRKAGGSGGPAAAKSGAGEKAAEPAGSAAAEGDVALAVSESEPAATASSSSETATDAAALQMQPVAPPAPAAAAPAPAAATADSAAAPAPEPAPVTDAKPTIAVETAASEAGVLTAPVSAPPPIATAAAPPAPTGTDAASVTSTSSTPPIAMAPTAVPPAVPTPIPVPPVPLFRFGTGLNLPMAKGGVVVQGPGQAFFFCPVAPAVPGAPAALPIPTQHAIAAGLVPRNTPPNAFIPVAHVNPAGVISLLAAGGGGAPGAAAGSSSGSGGGGAGSAAPAAPAAPKPRSGGSKSSKSKSGSKAAAGSATPAASSSSSSSSSSGTAPVAAPAAEGADASATAPQPAPSPVVTAIPASKLPPKLIAAAQAAATDPLGPIATAGRLRKQVATLASAAKAATSQRARAGAASPLGAFPALSDDVDGTTRWLVQEVGAGAGGGVVAAPAAVSAEAAPVSPVQLPGTTAAILPGAPRALSTLAAVLSSVVVACVGDVTTPLPPSSTAPPEALVLPMTSLTPQPRVPLQSRIIVSARLPDVRFAVARAVVDAALAAPIAFPLAGNASAAPSVHVATGHSLLFEIYDEPALAAAPRGPNASHPYAVKVSIPLATSPRLLLRKAVGALGPLLRRFVTRRTAAAEAFVAEAHAAAAALRLGLLSGGGSGPRRTVAHAPLVAATVADVSVAVIRPSKSGVLGSTSSSSSRPISTATALERPVSPANVSSEGPAAQAQQPVAAASAPAPVAAPAPPAAAAPTPSSASAASAIATDDRLLPVLGARVAALELADVYPLPATPEEEARAEAAAPRPGTAVSTLVELITPEDLGAAAAAEAKSAGSRRLLGRYLAAPRPFLELWRPSDGKQELAGAFAVLGAGLAAAWEATALAQVASDADEDDAMLGAPPAAVPSSSSSTSALPLPPSPPGIVGSLPLRLAVGALPVAAPAAAAEVARRRVAALIAEFAGAGLFSLASTLALWVPLDLQPLEDEGVVEGGGHGGDSDDPMVGGAASASASSTPFAGWRFPCAMPAAGIFAGAPPPHAPPALAGTAAAAQAGGEPLAAIAERIHAWALWQLQCYVIEGALTTPLGQLLVAPAAIASYVRWGLVQASTALVGPPPPRLPPVPAAAHSAPA